MDSIIDNIKSIDDKDVFKLVLNVLNTVEYRFSWDEYFILIATIIKKRSSCNKLHVGCLVTRNNRILATGYNGHVPGAPHTSKIVDNHEQMTIHAETNAICFAANNGFSLHLWRFKMPIFLKKLDK